MNNSIKTSYLYVQDKNNQVYHEIGLVLKAPLNNSGKT